MPEGKDMRKGIALLLLLVVLVACQSQRDTAVSTEGDVIECKLIGEIDGRDARVCNFGIATCIVTGYSKGHLAALGLGCWPN